MPRRTPRLTPKLIASYDGNVVRIEQEDSPVALAAAAVHEGPNTGCVYVVSIWNPYGRLSTPAENTHWAAAQLARPADHQRVAALHDPALTWVEQAVAITQLDVAQNIAQRYGQPALFRWDASSLSVLSTDRLEVVGSWPVAVQRLESRPCVMEPGPRSRPCQRRGGGYTSSSMAAALEWEIDFALRNEALLGCDVCQGRPRPGGHPIGLVELSAPSRWNVEHVVIGPL